MSKLSVICSSVAIGTALCFLLTGAAALAQVTFPKGGAVEVYNPEGSFYVYAPSVVLVGKTEHIFACKNPKDGVFRDEIIHLTRKSGQVVENKVVLRAGDKGTWDSFRV